MTRRGQNSFTRLPGFAARLYERLTHLEAIEQQHRDIAHELVSKIAQGRILDIGTGPGKLLLEIHNLRPDIKLYGLDVSEAMVHIANEKLLRLGVDLRRGDIRNTDYESDFFDVVTCTGSFYLWDNPEECLEEVFRIQKSGCSATFFETYRDYDATQVKAALKANLAEEGALRSLIASQFLMKQLRMAYLTTEVAEIIQRTSFARSYSIEKIILGGLPAWSRITLTKCA